MVSFAARRLLWSIPALLVVSALIFVLAALTPGDAARTVLGTNTDPAAYAQVREQLGLDEPLYSQYGMWVSQAVRGDLGQSLFTGEDVTTLISGRLGVTLSLIIGATALSAVLGISIGVIGAVRGGAVGRSADAVAMVGMSIPTFWLGLMLALVFAVSLQWLPATGYVPFAQSPSGWAESLVLPVVALAVSGVATIAKQTRGSLLDAMSAEHIRALRANGLPSQQIILRHCLKNAAVPVITVVGLVMIGLLAGTVVVEQIFGMPGLGQLAVTSTAQHDLPVLVGVVTVYTIIVLVTNLVVDLTYARLNPKIVAT